MRKIRYWCGVTLNLSKVGQPCIWLSVGADGESLLEMRDWGKNSSAPNSLGCPTLDRFVPGDESRLGLKTEPGRLITLSGIKPLGIRQWKRENFYLYGLVEPLTGEHYLWEYRSPKYRLFQYLSRKVCCYLS